MPRASGARTAEAAHVQGDRARDRIGRESTRETGRGARHPTGVRRFVPTACLILAGGAALASPATREVRGTTWVNTPGAVRPVLEGRVVLVEFWTFG